MASGRLRPSNSVRLATFLLALATTTGCTTASLTQQPVAGRGADIPACHTVAANRNVCTTAEQPVCQVQHTEQAPVLPAGAPANRYPIDLATALRLAGANNLQIALASERIREEEARLSGAEAAWLPSINAGVGYNKHDGRIQDTQGAILEVSRNSLFAGGGAALGGNSITGGSNGPPRLSVDFSLSDGLFAPLAQRQLVRAADAARAATFNDTLLFAALAYLDLQRAQGQVAVAQEAVKNAEELSRLIDARVKAGAAPPADGLRAQAELAGRRRLLAQAEEFVRVASAALVRLVRLDPATTLYPVESHAIPLGLVPEDVPLPDLLAQALVSRPELAQQQALVAATVERLRQEKWRPFIPNVHVGFSGGGFGGGEGSFAGNFSDRTDVDLLAVWQLRNLGFGNRALRRERASQNRQASLDASQLRDDIAAEVASAYYRVQHRRQQIEAAAAELKAAAAAVPLNFKGIIGGALRAIEAQQAITALATARNSYLNTIVEYNRSQFQLLRALGRPPDPTPCKL